MTEGMYEPNTNLAVLCTASSLIDDNVSELANTMLCRKMSGGQHSTDTFQTTTVLLYAYIYYM